MVFEKNSPKKSHKTHYFCQVQRVLRHKSILADYGVELLLLLSLCLTVTSPAEFRNSHLFKYRLGYLDERICLTLLPLVLIFLHSISSLVTFSPRLYTFTSVKKLKLGWFENIIVSPKHLNSWHHLNLFSESELSLCYFEHDM